MNATTLPPTDRVSLVPRAPMTPAVILARVLLAMLDKTVTSVSISGDTLFYRQQHRTLFQIYLSVKHSCMITASNVVSDLSECKA